MTENKHPTADQTELFDPVLVPPPTGGEHLLCINPGGVLIIGPWRRDYLAWGYKPRIPETVKIRIRTANFARTVRAIHQEIKGTPYV
jgi:hypothetical protein